jgi:hypothetical protein
VLSGNLKTRSLARSLAVLISVALAASTGCATRYVHSHAPATLLQVLGIGGCASDQGYSEGCGCSDNCPTDCSNAGCSGCTCRGYEASASGRYCTDCGCHHGSCDHGGCQFGGESPSLHLPALQPAHELACLPRDTFACAANCCTPHACPGPPDIPPPGRFHPVPTRPVFSPRFTPTPYGPAEY